MDRQTILPGQIEACGPLADRVHDSTEGTDRPSGVNLTRVVGRVHFSLLYETGPYLRDGMWALHWSGCCVSPPVLPPTVVDEIAMAFRDAWNRGA